MVVACLAEVAQDMGAPIATYIDVISLESQIFVHVSVFKGFYYVHS